MSGHNYPDKRKTTHRANKKALKINPLYLRGSLLLILIPATIFWLLIYFAVPAFTEKTSQPFLIGYLIWWISYMFMYFIASLVAYRMEGNKRDLRTFVSRYRLGKIKDDQWKWGLLLLFSFIVSITLLNVAGPWLASIPLLAPPESFSAELNPAKPEGRAPGEFMGLPLKGQWWLVIVYFLGWCFNIFGEEFWFRGYMLPRQEAAFGKRAWVVHGVVWAINHIWQGWTLVILLPYSFLWSYLIQRGKNTWIPIFVHGLGNLIPLIVIIIGVIG